MENSLAVSNFFIQKAIDDGQEMDILKLIKLVYIAHGWYLGIKGTPLLPEAIEAWKHGPVVTSVYSNFKEYKYDQIKELKFDMLTNTFPLPSNPEVLPFLEKVWQEYKEFSGVELSDLTHQPGTPWDTAWNKLGGKYNRNATISNDTIRNHYNKLANESQQEYTTNSTGI